MNQSKYHIQPARSELHCQLILDAAAEYFQQSGFYGASIAEISRLAGMSPGHIYHFFKNNEAIVSTIVERKVEKSLEIVTQFDKEAAPVVW